MDELPLALAGGFENSSVNLYHNRFVDIRPAAPRPVKIGVYCAVCATQISEMLAGHDLVVGEPASNLPNQLNRSANTFSNCQDGVFVQNRYRLKMRGNTLMGGTNTGVFMRLLQDNTQLLERNTLANNSLGIFIGNSNGVSATVRNNTITGNNTATRRGIRLDLIDHLGVAQGVYPVQITNNTIDLFGDGIWLNDVHHVNVENNPTIKVQRRNTTDQVRGVFVSSCTRVRVANNPDIFSAGTGSTNIATAGIYVSRSPETSVLCNNIRNIARCAVFEGLCEPSKFLGNKMRFGVDGFVMLNQGRIGPQGSVAIGNILATPSDNQWFGNTWFSWTNAISSIGNQSRLFVRPTGNYIPPTFPNMNKGSGQSFAIMQPQSVGTGPVTPVDCNGGWQTSATIAGVKNNATNRFQGNGPTIQAAQFRADEWAFSALLREPSLIGGDSVIQAFHAGCVGTSLGSSCNANEKLVMADSILAAQAAMAILLQSQSEVNSKAVMQIRLNNAQLDAFEIQQLQAIAAQCEEFGGKAVNIARGLLASEGIMVWEDPGCQGGQKAVEEATSDDGSGKGIEAECWPNPSDGQCFLLFNRPDVHGRLSLHDAQGRLLMSQEFDYERQPIAFDVGKWAQGFILAKVDLEDGGQFRWRLIIQR